MIVDFPSNQKNQENKTSLHIRKKYIFNNTSLITRRATKHHGLLDPSGHKSQHGIKLYCYCKQFLGGNLQRLGL